MATVIRDADARVPGLLWRLHAEDLDRLDGFEGYPWAYERRQWLVTQPDGRRRRAHVYFKADAILRSPSREYLGVIHEGYFEHGFDRDGLLQAMADAHRTKTSVFVYGMLRHGEANHYLIAHTARPSPPRAPNRASDSCIWVASQPWSEAGGPR